MALFQRIRAWQDETRFEHVYTVLLAQRNGQQYRLLKSARAAAMQVDAATFKSAGLSGKALGEAVHAARCAAIESLM